MKWSIPSKTFLLGEYAALAEGSAIILTTQPCFELSLSNERSLTTIHPQSPAGLWWQSKHTNIGLSWQDPYHGLGGLGASSAQFLGAYYADCYLASRPFDAAQMLEAYYASSWSGKGLKPSGYDVLAQSLWGCVFINKARAEVVPYAWPFKNLSFFIVHTGVKLATHEHLQHSTLPQNLEQLSSLVDKAHEAFQKVDSETFVWLINQYHEELKALNRVAAHSLEYIALIKTHPEVLAIKGCGAMGSDTLLIISASSDACVLKNKLLAQSWPIVATEQDLLKNIKKLSNRFTG